MDIGKEDSGIPLARTDSIVVLEVPGRHLSGLLIPAAAHYAIDRPSLWLSRRPPLGAIVFEVKAKQWQTAVPGAQRGEPRAVKYKLTMAGRYDVSLGIVSSLKSNSNRDIRVNLCRFGD